MDLRNEIKEVLEAYKSEVDNFNAAVFTEKFDAVANDLNDLFDLHSVGVHESVTPENFIGGHSSEFSFTDHSDELRCNQAEFLQEKEPCPQCLKMCKGRSCKECQQYW
jgi:hypothetical protein